MEFDHSTDTILPDDQAVIIIGGTGGITIPSGDIAQRSGGVGTMRWNTETVALEVLNGSSIWQNSVSMGISQLGKYKSVTNNQAASDPGSGNLKWNNVTQSSSTSIYIDSLTGGGFDATNYFNAIKVPSVLVIQDTDDASIFQRWTVTSIVDSTGWFTFTVTYIDGSGTFSNNKNIVIALMFNGSTVTDLSYTASTRLLASSTGTDVTLPLVNSTEAGLAPLSGGGTTNFLRADGTWAAPGGGGATNLAYNTPTNTVTSDTGTDATIPLFTSAQAGLAPASGGGSTNYMCANGNWTAPPGVTNIGYTPSTRTVTSDTGTDAVLPLFTSGQDGMTPQSGGGTTNFLRADGTWAAPGGGGATNLGYTASTRILTSDTGTDVTLPLYTSTDPGLTPLSGGGTVNLLRADGTWTNAVTGTFTAAGFTPSAGTVTQAPLVYTSGTNLTTAAAGAHEFDGNAFYKTIVASNRGVERLSHFVVLTSANTLTSQTAAQALFDGGGGPATGAITLPVGTYRFECQFSLTAMSATSGSYGFALGGTATKTQAWTAICKDGALATAGNSQITYNTAANVTLCTASTATTGMAVITGIIRVTVTGTIIPQVSLTTANAAVVGANSFFSIEQIGNSTVATVGNWS